MHLILIMNAPPATEIQSRIYRQEKLNSEKQIFTRGKTKVESTQTLFYQILEIHALQLCGILEIMKTSPTTSVVKFMCHIF
jgi:hypothetical protein